MKLIYILFVILVSGSCNSQTTIKNVLGEYYVITSLDKINNAFEIYDVSSSPKFLTITSDSITIIGFNKVEIEIDRFAYAQNDNSLILTNNSNILTWEYKSINEGIFLIEDGDFIYYLLKDDEIEQTTLLNQDISFRFVKNSDPQWTKGISYNYALSEEGATKIAVTEQDTSVYHGSVQNKQFLELKNYSLSINNTYVDQSFFNSSATGDLYSLEIESLHNTKVTYRENSQTLSYELRKTHALLIDLINSIDWKKM
jgi:hypothetical protein